MHLSLIDQGLRNMTLQQARDLQTWTKDGKGFDYSMPLKREWADLYQTWNMAFCSQISDFPMVLPKLFIPEVADYQKEPGVYIYRRAIALYLHLNYGAFEAVRCAKEKRSWD